jgi:hypothetical protein
MFSKDRLLDLFNFVHQQETAFIDRLTPDQRDAVGQRDDWAAKSPKDVIAHLGAWKERVLDDAQSAARGERVVEDDRHEDVINAEIYAQHEAKSWDEVRLFADDAHRRLMDFVRATPEDTLADPDLSIQGDGRPIWQALTADYVSHTIEHLTDFYLQRGEPQRAVTLQQAITERLSAFGDPLITGFAYFDLACVCSRAGRAEDGIRALGEALRHEPRLTPRSQRDPALEALRGEPGYQALYT